MKYAVYGTVYNCATSVENSIRSVFRPEYEIVIVDSYSTDGTWEILSEIRQDYNLKLIQQNCTRGEGRNLALKHCPEYSRTAYVDFDTEYNENFHTLMRSHIDNLFCCSDQWTFYISKEKAINSMGWRNLNVDEDLEFIARNGINVTAPVIIGFNLRVGDVNREIRYTNNILAYYRRMIRIKTDTIRGHGMNLSELASAPLSWKPTLYTLYLLARLKGIYRQNKKLDNWKYVEKMILNTLIDPEQFGISNSWILFPYYSRGVPPDDLLKKVWGHAFKIACREMYEWARGPSVIYVKDLEALNHLQCISYMLGCECFEKL